MLMARRPSAMFGVAWELEIHPSHFLGIMCTKSLGGLSHVSDDGPIDILFDTRRHRLFESRGDFL